jgi:CRP/FNR family transcriptional regulator
MGGAWQIEELAACDVRRRLARYLLEKYERQQGGRPPGSIVIPVSRSLLAAQLGTILETLSRTFKRLATEGVIRIRGRTVLFPDIDAMRHRTGA